MALWEQLLVGAIAVLVLLLFFPGVRGALEQSRKAEKDWPAVLVPIALVVLFVLLLIALV